MATSCWRPDLIMRLGVVQPAGCAVVVARDIQANARSFAGPVGGQQFANTPTVIGPVVAGERVTYVASGPTARAARHPNFLARFFGAK